MKLPIDNLKQRAYNSGKFTPQKGNDCGIVPGEGGLSAGSSREVPAAARHQDTAREYTQEPPHESAFAPVGRAGPLPLQR